MSNFEDNRVECDKCLEFLSDGEKYTLSKVISGMRQRTTLKKHLERSFTALIAGVMLDLKQEVQN